MNEKIKGFLKISRFWLIVGAVLLIWAVSATISAVVCHGEYKATVAIIDAAGGDKFFELAEQHGDSIVEVLDDIVATRIELQSAVGRAAELDQRDRRIREYAQLANAELIGIGDAMASAGNTLQDSISLQRRIIEAFGRIKTYISAIKAELGDSP